ncbi:hypothetical protein DERP_013806 [Dermatophagoides pteronyssinus]|uniref:Uncharacterized protein n=1 Tax=Dermatophagoides pteronyssinus TaxID=6956 RepID=A0ABQ8JCT1_DERPT|nr:hypothetical protein DERP_013806 [Dermatophagoides pteronyssinus]
MFKNNKEITELNFNQSNDLKKIINNNDNDDEIIDNLYIESNYFQIEFENREIFEYSMSYLNNSNNNNSKNEQINNQKKISQFFNQPRNKQYFAYMQDEKLYTIKKLNNSFSISINEETIVNFVFEKCYKNFAETSIIPLRFLRFVFGIGRQRVSGYIFIESKGNNAICLTFDFTTNKGKNYLLAFQVDFQQTLFVIQRRFSFNENPNRSKHDETKLIEQYYGNMTIKDFIKKVNLSHSDHINKYGIKFKNYLIKTKALKMPKIFPNFKFNFPDPERKIRWIVLSIEYKFKMDDCLFTQLIKCINIEELENIFSNLIRFDVDYVLFGITEDFKINGMSGHDIIKYLSLCKFGIPCQIFKTKNFYNTIEFDESLFIKMSHRLGEFPINITEEYWNINGFIDSNDSIFMAVNCTSQQIQGKTYFIMSIVSSKDHKYILYDEAHIIDKIQNFNRLRQQMYLIICKYKERFQRMPKTVILYYNEKNDKDFIQIEKLCDLSIFHQETESIKWVIINIVLPSNIPGKMFGKPDCNRYSYLIEDEKIFNENGFILCHNSSFENSKAISMKCVECIIKMNTAKLTVQTLAQITDFLCYLFTESFNVKNQPLPLSYAINSTRQAFSRLNGKLFVSQTYLKNYSEEEFLDIMNILMKYKFLHEKISNPYV